MLHVGLHNYPHLIFTWIQIIIQLEDISISWLSVLNNGIIIQHGVENNRTNEITTTLPISYNGLYFSVVVFVKNITNGQARRLVSKNTTSFTTSRAGDTNTAFEWITVGS